MREAASRIRATPARRRRRRRRALRASEWQWQAVEAACLGSTALVLVIGVLGRAAANLAGIGVWDSLMPFALVVLALAILLAAGFWGWLAVRAWLGRRAPWLPAVLAGVLAIGSGWVGSRSGFQADVAGLRGLLGGRAEAERRAIAHQVFASYRRTPVQAWTRLLQKSAKFEAVVHEAAAAYGVDPEVLMGIAAAESGFDPRQSKDGGRGLFQITNAPADALNAVRDGLGVERLDLQRTPDNAYVAASMLSLYLTQMNGDLFLGLLAYNLGPSNGGLRSIMKQYGARDFVTIQPYLQNLPRDYPIRVLAAALAYRLWKRDGTLPRYEEGENALRIQQIGVPGL